MKKLASRLIPLLIIGLAIGLFMYMKKTKPQQPPVEIKEKIWMVHSQSIQLENLPAVQTLYGVVESNSMVKAAAPIAAVVDKVAVLPGDEVKKGQLLVALSELDVTLPLEQAKADVADMQAQVALQKMTMQANQQRLAHEQKVLGLKQESLQRTKALIAKNLASQSAVDAANEALVKQEYAVVGVELLVEQGDAQLAQLQARLQKANTALAQAKLNLERSVVRAPFDGRIADVMVSQGDRVNAGTVLVSFYGLDSLELKAKLPASGLQQAQQALNQQQVLSADYGVSEQSITLNLVRLAGEATTSGVDAYFDLPESLYAKRPGELLEVYFKGQALQQVAAVPYSAIYGNDEIYVIVDDRLQAIKVQLQGEIMREGKLLALIQSPELEAGKTILVTHLPNAMTGLKVSEVQ